MYAKLPLLALVLAACNPLPEQVKMKGEVRDGIDTESTPFANAKMTVLNEAGKQQGTATTDGSGKFSTNVPAGERFHVLIEGDGHVPASFTGLSGLQETFAIDEGTLHGVTQLEFDAWTAQFAGCPGVGEGGGAILGEPRIEELVDENGQHPGVSAAVAEVWDPKSEKVIATACYLGEDDLYDPNATATGDAGVFAIYGVPEGTYVLSVGLEVFPDSWTWEDTVVYVPDEGVAPRFPSWVHFPL